MAFDAAGHRWLSGGDCSWNEVSAPNTARPRMQCVLPRMLRRTLCVLSRDISRPGSSLPHSDMRHNVLCTQHGGEGEIIGGKKAGTSPGPRRCSATALACLKGEVHTPCYTDGDASVLTFTELADCDSTLSYLKEK